eukprot:3376176-Pleurochrysis_carterae.AAC.1
MMRMGRRSHLDAASSSESEKVALKSNVCLSGRSWPAISFTCSKRKDEARRQGRGRRQSFKTCNSA